MAQETPPIRPLPLIKEIHVEKIGALTGPDSPNGDRTADVCSTDLGTMTEIGRRIFFAFGDTFGYGPNNDSSPRNGIDWRSNLFASATLQSDALERSGNLKIPRLNWRTDRTGKAIPVVEGAHLPPFTGTHGEQTRIPTAMVSVGNRIFLHYMSVHGFAPRGGVWECNFSKFIYSDDLGKSWTPIETLFGGQGSNFNMLALTNERGTGNKQGRYVYALGTPCGRFGGTQVARAPADRFSEFEAWEYFCSTPTGPERTQWTSDPGKATEIIPPPVGEASILWNPFLRRWLYTYLNEQTASIELREAPNPWGPWTIPETVTTSRDYPQLYGAFMTPSLVRDKGKTLYFVMSMYGAYNTFLMKATLTTD